LAGKTRPGMVAATTPRPPWLDTNT
jgi:hypothetical protein